MIRVADYVNNTDSEITVNCIDGQVVDGHLASVNDEEETGMDELSITVLTHYGRIVIIGESEIDSIIF